MFKQEVAKKIQEARKAKGWTQTQLARKMGVNRITITKYESGKLNMSLDVINHIAESLEVAPSIIFSPKSDQ